MDGHRITNGVSSFHHIQSGSIDRNANLEVHARRVEIIRYYDRDFIGSRHQILFTLLEQLKKYFGHNIETIISIIFINR